MSDAVYEANLLREKQLVRELEDLRQSVMDLKSQLETQAAICVALREALESLRMAIDAGIYTNAITPTGGPFAEVMANCSSALSLSPTDAEKRRAELESQLAASRANEARLATALTELNFCVEGEACGTCHKRAEAALASTDALNWLEAQRKIAAAEALETWIISEDPTPYATGRRLRAEAAKLLEGA
jgi:hypothetical protein